MIVVFVTVVRREKVLKGCPKNNMNDQKRTDTAHLDWEKRWRTDEGRKQWQVPDTDVVDIVPFLMKRQVREVLDLGCGIGRHSLFLADKGFRVHAIDGSPAGIAHLKDQAKEKHIEIDARHAEMTRVPYEDESMDYVLAWNVIYHGNLPVVLRVISEILRVLKPNGLLHGTMLSKRHIAMREGREVDQNTFITDGRSDKGHPHYYCNALELTSLLEGFEFWWLKDQEHRREQTYHWHFLAEKIR